MITNASEKQKKRMVVLGDELERQIATVRDIVDEKADGLQVKILDQGEFFRKEIEKTKTYATDLIDITKDTILSQVEADVGGLTETFENTRGDIVQKFEKHSDKAKRSISNIKDSCAGFFQQYDL